MTLSFSSLEEAWGGKSTRNGNSFDEWSGKTMKPHTTNRLPGNSISNVSKQSASAVHSTTFNVPQKQNIVENDKYENMYCNTIANHVQACPYCQERIKSMFQMKAQPVPVVEEKQETEVQLTPNVLTRKNDNMAYIPFNMEPEVFNIMLFSIILISLMFLVDKRGMKLFKF